MTLVEVMIAITIITFFALTAYNITLFNYRRTMANFYRLEAYRLAQTISERAMELPFPANFNAAGVKTNDLTDVPQWIWTDQEPATLRATLLGSTAAQFVYPTTSSVTFTKAVTDRAAGSYSGSASVIDVTISWVYNRRNYSVTLPVVRGV